MNKKAALRVLFLTTFLDLMGFGLIIPILPTLASDLGATEAQVGLIAAIYALMNFFFSPFWGALSDRHGRRPIILVSVLITAVAYFVFAQSEVIWILILSRVFSGIGSANIGAAQAYIGDITEAKDRAKTMGLIGAAFGLGFIFGPPIGGWLKSTYNLAAVGYVAGSLSLLNFLLAFFYLPESIKKKNASAIRIKFFSSLIKNMRKPKISQLFTINLIYITAFAMMQVTAVLLWAQHSDLSELQIGYVFMYIGLSSAIVQGTLVGPITKRFGERRMLVIGLVMMMIGLFAMPFFQSEYFFPYEFLALSLIALANGFVSPALLSLVTQVSEPHEVGAITGANQSFGSIGRVIGPIVGGVLYQINYFLPYVVGPIVLIIALWLAIRFKRKSLNLEEVL